MAKTPPKPPTPRQTSQSVSSLASGIMTGRIDPTPIQMRRVAASALGQDQTRGGKK